MCSALRHLPISMEVRYDLPDFRRRMLAAERRSGNRYLPIAGPPMTTGLKPICRMKVDAISIACGLRRQARLTQQAITARLTWKAKALGV